MEINKIVEAVGQVNKIIQNVAKINKAKDDLAEVIKQDMRRFFHSQATGDYN